MYVFKNYASITKDNFQIPHITQNINRCEKKSEW